MTTQDSLVKLLDFKEREKNPWASIKKKKKATY